MWSHNLIVLFKIWQYVDFCFRTAVSWMVIVKLHSQLFIYDQILFFFLSIRGAKAENPRNSGFLSKDAIVVLVS